jgi:GT2 family glycosyltransferase
VDRCSGITEHKEHHRWFLTLGQIQPYEPERELTDGVITTDYMPLCAALISRNVFDDIGLLDEEYFLYGSDVDFFIRAWENGHIAVTNTQEHIHHKVSSSSNSAIGPTISYYASRNRLLLQRKFSNIFSWSSLLFYCWWLILHLGFRIYNTEIAAAVALLRGAFDGFRGRTGSES